MVTSMRNRTRWAGHRPIQGGFSLIELVTVLTIVGVVAGMAIETFPSLVNNQRAKAASFDLYSSLSLARTEALKRGSNVSVTATGGDWSGGWSVSSSGGAVLHTHDSPSGVQITGSATSVTFNRNGRLSGASPTFEIDVTAALGDFIRCVRLDLSGSPRTSRGAC